MKKLHLMILILTFNFGLSQTKAEIDSLLNEISKTENSKEIINTNEGKKFIEYGWKLLPMLSEFFVDQTEANVKSECVGRNLTKGEIAIILADRIEGMQYFRLTKIQNCTFTFCEKNLNLIEYYLDAIKRDNVEEFKARYIEWLESDERIEWQSVYKFATEKERKNKIKALKKAKLEKKL